MTRQNKNINQTNRRLVYMQKICRLDLVLHIDRLRALHIIRQQAKENNG